MQIETLAKDIIYRGRAFSVRRDLVRRAESADDRRALELSLTLKGRSLLQGYHDARFRTMAALFPGFESQQFLKVSVMPSVNRMILSPRWSGRSVSAFCGSGIPMPRRESASAAGSTSARSACSRR